MNIYSKNNQPNGFYIYAYLRRDGTPYYIGKGKSDRAWQDHRYKSRTGNYMLGVHTPPDNRIVIMESGLTEIGAFSLERRMIRWYGRKDNRSEPGILLNKTDGGDGVYGYVATDKTREKLRIANTGKKQSPEEVERKRQRQLGQKYSPERNANISAALTGRKLSEEHIARRSETVKGRKQSKEVIEKRVNQLRGRRQKVITCPYCNTSGGNIVMKRHHFDRCKLKPPT